MIIECQTCHARFRLDESRIKGRGARVKCRKCGDSIVVLKDGAPAPPTPGGDGFFDLGSAVRDSAGERPGSPPPVGNLIPFPAPPRPVEPFAAESSSPAVEAAGPGKDEVDLAFDRVLSAAMDGSFPSIREAEAEVKVERYAAAGPVPRPETDLGALHLELGPEEKLDLPPAEEPEPPPGEPPVAEPAARVPWRGGVPDQRFGYPGFPAGETSRHGVGSSPGGRRYLPGDLVHAVRRGEFLPAWTRRAPHAA